MQEKSKRDVKRNKKLLPIPDKIYFTIGEVSHLCDLKPHVLRYWEQEFSQLSPVKRRGNRRYYQRKDVLLIRRIQNLLYEQGFTIEGARQKLTQEHNQQVELPLDEGISKHWVKKTIADLEKVLNNLQD